MSHGLSDPPRPPQASRVSDEITLPAHPDQTIDLGPGRDFDGFELLEELGRGGMGVVYKARQQSLDRLVAIKMILGGHLASAGDVKRFRSEATAAASLRHPNIVSIHGVDSCDGQHYFTMPLIDGESLAATVVRAPLPPRDAAEIMKTVAEAIHHAHTQGVIHRDIKPANILIDRQGVPFVSDFGLAKRLDGAGSTRPGELMGTVGFLPPEQAMGETGVDRRSDVYSLGATLYCLLTGHAPFHAASHIDTLFQVMHREPVPIRRLNESVPRDLETICMRCIEKQPNRRLDTAAEVAAELQRFLDGVPIRARPISTSVRLLKWARRRRAQAALAVTAIVSVLALVATMWFSLLSIRQERKQAVEAQERAEQVIEVLMQVVKERADENALEESLQKLEPERGVEQEEVRP